MKYYLIAGEASGDIHGANLMSSIKNTDPKAQFRCWGGDKMEAQGGKIIKHYRDLAFMGFVEVLQNLPTILRNLSFCKKDIINYQPDVLILIDYPGFNLKIAKFAHKKNLKVVYYISPTVWAWKQSRVYTIKKYVNRMMVILPFEKEFYAKFEVSVDFVGHPLLDEIKQEDHLSNESFRNKFNLDNRPIIALLPGSRIQEITRILPIMLEAATDFSEYQFVIAGVKSVPENVYKYSNIKVIFNKTHELLYHAHAALVTSGTATLETALLDTPQIVCYKAGSISYFIAKQLVNIRFISLVNLIMDKEVVKELIQDELTVTNIKSELKNILNPDNRKKIFSEYTILRQKLGKSGASDKAAKVILELLQN